MGAVLVLLLVPIPHPFSLQFTTTFASPGTVTLSPPALSQVSGTYSTGNGGAVWFQIQDAFRDTIFSGIASNGSFSFSASLPPYTFTALTGFNETVSVKGTYSTPIL